MKRLELSSVLIGLMGLIAAAATSGCQSTYVGPPGPPIHVCPAWGCDGPPTRYPFPIPTPTPTICPAESFGSSGGCGGGPIGGPVGPVPYSGGESTASSFGGGGTKDVDLQRQQLQQGDADARAQALADGFQMSFASAVQLVRLGDAVQQMTATGAMTDADRAAVTQSALSIAGISQDQVDRAVADAQQGDRASSEALLTQAAQNLGMPSSAALRDQLLPALGVNLGN